MIKNLKIFGLLVAAALGLLGASILVQKRSELRKGAADYTANFNTDGEICLGDEETFHTVIDTAGFPVDLAALVFTFDGGKLEVTNVTSTTFGGSVEGREVESGEYRVLASVTATGDPITDQLVFEITARGVGVDNQGFDFSLSGEVASGSTSHTVGGTTSLKVADCEAATNTPGVSPYFEVYTEDSSGNRVDVDRLETEIDGVGDECTDCSYLRRPNRDLGESGDTIRQAEEVAALVEAKSAGMTVEEIKLLPGLDPGQYDSSVSGNSGWLRMGGWESGGRTIAFIISGSPTKTPEPTATATPTNTPIPEEEACEAEGGTWEEFSDACVDSCEKVANPGLICAQVLTYGCDCGPDQCWSFESDQCKLNSEVVSPQITAVTPSQVYLDQTVTITGSNFGSQSDYSLAVKGLPDDLKSNICDEYGGDLIGCDENNSKLRINGLVDITSWNDTEITIKAYENVVNLCLDHKDLITFPVNAEIYIAERFSTTEISNSVGGSILDCTQTTPTPTNTPPGDCISGDADCDGDVDFIDFSAWRSAKYDAAPANNGDCSGQGNDVYGDTDCNGRVEFIDFSVWRSAKYD